MFHLNKSPFHKASLILLLIAEVILSISLFLQDLTLTVIPVYYLLGALIIVSIFAVLFGKLIGFLSALLFSAVYLMAWIIGSDFGLSELLRDLSQYSAVLGPLFSLLVLGFVLGLLSEHFGYTSLEHIRKTKHLSDENSLLHKQVDELEKAMDKVSHTLISDQGTSFSQDELEIARRIMDLISHAVSPSSLASHFPDKANRDIFDTNQINALQVLFELLLVVRPETLAILDSSGKILCCNEPLMAIYGYPDASQMIQAPFSDCLTSEDASRLVNILEHTDSTTAPDQEVYCMRSPQSSIRLSIVPQEVVLDRIGITQTLVASLKSINTRYDDYFSDAEQTMGFTSIKTLADLYAQQFCCLSDKQQVLFASQSLSSMLGLPTQRIKGQRFDQLLSYQQHSKFKDFLSSCSQGAPVKQNFELTIEDEERIISIEAFPILGDNSICLGTVLILTDITDFKQTEKELNHRLELEKLISKISTQFISAHPSTLDESIKSVLRRIGDYENALESEVEIYPSNRIHEGICFRVSNTEEISEPARFDTPSKRQIMAVSIPIVVGSETVGAFKFYQYENQIDWLKTDTELIRLIGEIFINALIRRDNEIAIRRNETRLRTTLHSIGDAVIATDTQNQVILLNQTAERLTGWSVEEAIDKTIDEIFKPDTAVELSEDDPLELRMKNNMEEDSFMLRSRQGSEYYISFNQSTVMDNSGNIYGQVTVFRDITRQKLENDEIRYISYHDKLTGLYNRAFFEEEMDRLNTERQYPITVIIGDCNGLKIANDVFGHLQGDRLLQTIADIIRKATRKEDIVARWGGDEFAVILPKTDEETGAAIRERILNLCAEAPFDPIQPSIALGSATNVDTEFASDDMQSLLKLAEDRMYRHKLMEGKSVRNSILSSIERMIFEKSYETEEHARRLNDIAQKIGNAVGLSEFELEELSLLSVLHDIGKIGIPDSILQKPASLSAGEWEIMKKHAEKGYDLARSTPELSSIAEPILHHHERWDGTGYPSGLRGDEIPKLSRIISIIDAYDVITHSRAYKEAQNKQDALKEIERCSGSQFDPDLVQLFMKIMAD